MIDKVFRVLVRCFKYICDKGACPRMKAEVTRIPSEIAIKLAEDRELYNQAEDLEIQAEKLDEQIGEMILALAEPLTGLKASDMSYSFQWGAPGLSAFVFLKQNGIAAKTTVFFVDYRRSVNES